MLQFCQMVKHFYHNDLRQKLPFGDDNDYLVDTILNWNWLDVGS